MVKKKTNLVNVVCERPLIEIHCICVFPKTQRPPASAVHYKLGSVLLGVVLRSMPYDMVCSCENSINGVYVVPQGSSGSRVRVVI